MVKKLFVSLITAILLFAYGTASAEEGQLWRLADDKGCIKVFIAQPVNESDQAQILPDSLKKAIETTLLNRKSTKFVITTDPKDSDIQVSSIIKQFKYLDKGPFKPTPGIGTTLLDAAASMTANYVEMTTLFTVTRTSSGEILWQDTLNPYIKQRMTPQESISVIAEKMARHFLWKCFGKPAK